MPNTKHNAYPKYKPSGVEWLGDVPEHWSVLRLKYSADLINEKATDEVADLPYTGLEHIESWTGRRIAPNDESTNDGQANRFKPGDVLFGKLRPYLAKAHAASEDGICTGELLVLRPKHVQQQFLLDYVLNPEFINEVDSSTYGSKMPRANWDFIGNLPVLTPPESEQRAIAAFLDRETGRIDALIAKKERQIELLREKRAALISHAVTKGLDPNAPLKDSGIEWLGQIPESWDVKKNRYLFKERNERNRPELPILSVSIHDGAQVRVFSEDKVEQKSDDLSIYKCARRGDIAYNMMRFWQGAVGVAPVDGLISPAYTVAYPIENINTRYFECIFRTPWYKTEINRYSYGIVPDRNRLYWDQFAQLYSPVPPFDAQNQIMEEIDSKSNQIDQLHNCIIASIDKLREYRTALISAAVTGKIDVRREVA